MLFSLTMIVLLHKWEFMNIEIEFLKVSEKFDHQDFQILELGSPGTSWFWQLVQALVHHIFVVFLLIKAQSRAFRLTPATVFTSIS